MVEGPRVLGFAACLEAGTCPPIAE